MKVLIDVPENFKYFKQCRHAMASAIDKGIVLDGLTNGEVIQKMFPCYNVEVYPNVGYVLVFCEDFSITYPFDWWNRRWGE